MPEQYRRPHHHERVQIAERMKRASETEADALATVRDFNNRLRSGRVVWAWPTIAAALTAKRPWLSILCESCDGVTDLDLRMKPRPPDASIRIALRDVKCPRCNGHGRPRIIGLSSGAK